MTISKQGYLAYLLRLWQEIDAGKITWRASLEDPHTGNRQGFANIETLFDYLHQLVRGYQLEKEGGQDQENEPCE